MYNHFDPYDPMQPYFDPLPERPTKEQLDEFTHQSMIALVRSVAVFVAALALLAVCSLLTGCTTQKTVTSDVSDHRVTDLMQRMDSLIGVHSVVQQDSTWRQEILRQFQSIREKSDTSHYVVQDTAGNVIRERIVINNTREVTSETDRQEREVMMHRLEQMDSTVQAQALMISHMDSLMQQSRKEVVKTVETPTSWWQQIQIWLGRLVLVALAVLAAIVIFRKEILWHFMKR